MTNVYPLTIIKDRYGGVYSGGEYVAFNLCPWEVPAEAHGDDVTCGNFWQDTDLPYGAGATPHEAIRGLHAALKGGNR